MTGLLSVSVFAMCLSVFQATQSFNTQSELLQFWKLSQPRSDQKHVKRQYILPVKSKSACELPLGLHDRRIPDESITASSVANPQAQFASHWARLNTEGKKDRNYGSWVAAANNVNQWLQVDLGENAYVTKVGIQGRQDHAQWVTSFVLKCSLDGVHWVEYKENSVVKVLPGNNEQYNEVVNDLSPPFLCRYIQFNPRSWHGQISMRAEVYGCKNVYSCALPVGVEDRRIADSAMSASSEFNAGYAATQGRLNFQGGGGKSGSWSAKTNDKSQWLQINFGHVYGVTKVGTQGRFDADQWVERYRLSYSSDGAHYAFVMENSVTKEFAANTDRNTIIMHPLNERLDAQYLRFHPQVWRGHISMRVEVYGCNRVHSCLTAVGIEDGRISDQAITASSSYSTRFLPPRGRMNSGQAWAAKDTSSAWIQADMGKMMRVTGIGTQGRFDSDQWVKSYFVTYSYDGSHWVTFKENSQGKIFEGNSDRNTIVRNVFYPVLFGRVVRINIKSFHGHPSMRFELYGCKPSDYCSGPLGSEDHRIPNGAFSASTYYDANHPPHNARLNLNDGGGKCGCWAAKANDDNQYLQINLGHPSTVTKIGTQGRGSDKHFQWVTSYTLEYSVDALHWTSYFLSDGRIKTFGGNIDSNSVVFNYLERPIHASFVRIRPKTWHGHISMRAELYGCAGSDVCLLPLGLQDHRIPDDDLSASTNYKTLEAARGRLNLVNGGGKGGAWCVTVNNANQYFQVDLLHPTLVTKIAIQGRQDHPQWVVKYRLSYSFDGSNWITYKGGSYPAAKDFPGNFDQHSIVTSHVYPPVYARMIRIHPKAWHRHICLRAELYGCLVQGHVPPFAAIAA